MRKPRDYDAELKALDSKARALRERKVRQLGELVITCGADTLPVEQLAGMLLAGTELKEHASKEAWRERGAAFFHAKKRTQARAGGDTSGAETGSGSA